ncbi:MAG: cytochrome c biogenesis protein CcdA [bacterium]
MNSTAQDVNIIIAFIAGLLSFFSPCVLPVIPSYLAFITGLSFEEMNENQTVIKRRLFFNSLIFILGFSLIFIFLGAGATLIGKFLITYKLIIQKVGGILIILFGIHITGLVPLNLLQKEKRVHLKNKPFGYLGSFLVGLAFASGWTPCIGPILGAILIYAATSDNVYSGIILLSSYSLGLGLPFLIVSLGLSAFLTHFNWMKRYLRPISIFSGILLILIGIMIFADKLGMVTGMITGG